MHFSFGVACWRELVDQMFKNELVDYEGVKITSDVVNIVS